MVDIREYLPHRYPFLLIDRMVSLEGDHFEAIKNITFNEPQFQGHFPQEPVMPGMLMLEAMAQAGAIAIMVAHDLKPESVGYLRTVDGVKFIRKVVPGDQLRLSGDILSFRRGLGKFSCTAFVEDEVAVKATLSIFIPV